MEKCFEDLQNELINNIKYRLDYFEEFTPSFIFENSDVSIEFDMDVEYDGYEYKLKNISFGYFESEVYPPDILNENLHTICKNVIFFLNQNYEKYS